MTRSLSVGDQSTAIASFSSASEKNVRLRSLAMIQRVATSTADLDLGLVARLVGTRRHDGRVVVGRHLGVAAVDRRLVEARLGDAGLQVVGHHHRRHAAEEGEGARVRADPVGAAPASRSPRHRCSSRRRARRRTAAPSITSPVAAVDHLQRRAGVVDEQPLAGHMRLPHGRRQPPLPGPVELAEPAVAVAVGVRGRGTPPTAAAASRPAASARDGSPASPAVAADPWRRSAAADKRDSCNAWRNAATSRRPTGAVAGRKKPLRPCRR